MKIRIQGIVAALFLLSAVLLPLIVRAQNPSSGINLTISPSTINIVVDPGEKYSTLIKIKNNSNVREYLRLDLNKFDSIQGGEETIISPLSSSDTFRSWLSFSEKELSVDPNETKTIKITFTPPKNSGLGYYYAVLITRTGETKTVGNATAVVGSPAILVLAEVRSPNAKRELQLLDFTTDSFIYETLPVEFRAVVKNTGNVHVAPLGDIFIDRGNTKEIGIVRANEKRSTILPQSERTISATWDDGFLVRVPKSDRGAVMRNEKGEIVYETKWDLTKVHKIRIGKYTAHLLMVYDNGERDIPVEATVSFWVIPWKILLVIGVILFFTFLGIKNSVSSGLRSMRR